MKADYVTRVLSTFGDVNPIDHAGGYIYCRRDNEHAPESPTAELEYIEPPLGRGRNETWDCIECDGSPSSDCDCEHESCDNHGESECIACKGTGEDASLRWTVYTVLIEAYDWVDWEGVASYTGMPIEDYREAFTSGNRVAMAHAIVDAASYHGWYEFDQEPLQFTRSEIEARCEALDAFKVTPDNDSDERCEA